jgi:hypothetical protein
MGYVSKGQRRKTVLVFSPLVTDCFLFVLDFLLDSNTGVVGGQINSNRKGQQELYQSHEHPQ